MGGGGRDLHLDDHSAFPNMVRVQSHDNVGSQSATGNDLLVIADKLYRIGFGDTLFRYDLPMAGTIPTPATLTFGANYRLARMSTDGATLFIAGKKPEVVDGVGLDVPIFAAVDLATFTLLGDDHNGLITWYNAPPLVPIAQANSDTMAAAYGRCTSANHPCLVTRDLFAGLVSLFEVQSIASGNVQTPLRRTLCNSPGTHCDQSDTAVRYTREVALRQSGSTLYTTARSSSEGFQVWAIGDSWAMTHIASLPGGYGGLYLDEVANVVVAAGDGKVDFIDVSVQSAPIIFHTLHYDGLGVASRFRMQGTDLFVQMDNQVRRIDLSAGYAGAIESMVVGGGLLLVSMEPDLFAVYSLDNPAMPTPAASVAGALGEVRALSALGFVTRADGSTRIVDLR